MFVAARSPLFVLLLIFLLTLGGCVEEKESTAPVSSGGEAQPPEPYQAASSSLSGQITLSSLVAGGDVWISSSESQHSTLPPEDKQIVKAAVGNTGEFSFNSLSPGADYSLTYIDDAGNGAKIDSINLSPDESKKINLTEDDVKPTGSVSFSVQSLNSGFAITEAKAYLHELGITYSPSDASPFFRIDNLPEGSYSITISSAGFVAKYFTFNVLSAQETELPPVELNAEKGQLVGMVAMDNAASLANVLIYAKAPDGSIFTALPGNSGLYKFPALPVGEGYSLVAVAQDHSPTKVSNISVVKGTTTTAPTLTLSPLYSAEGSLSGFARFGSITGLNHAGIIVSVEGTAREAITARDGAFVIDSLEPGVYTVNFTDSNHKTVSQSITVVAGSTTTLPKVSLQALTGQLSGLVVDDAGDPVPNANVVVDTPTGTLSTVSASDGGFSLGGIISGLHRLVISKEGYGIGFRNIQISADQLTNISAQPIQLQRLLLTGRVSLGKDLIDHSGVAVSLTGADSSPAITDSEGNFTLYGVPQGNYELQLSKTGFVTRTLPITVTSDNGYAIGYTLELERAFGTLSGLVELQNASDYSGIAVSIQGTGYATLTNALGAWSIDLPVGEYSNSLLINRSGYETGELTGSFTIKVTEPRNLGVVTLLSKTAQIIGVVLDDQGNAVSNASVSVISQNNSESVVTDELGQYVLTGIPVGSQTLVASKEGYGTGSISFELVEGENKDLSGSPVVLQRLLLTGKVLLEGGETDFSGVSVSLSGFETAPAITDAEGNFTLKGIGAGNYQLQLSKAGYLTETIPIAISSNNGYAIPYTLSLEPQRGLVKGVAHLAGFTDSSGILVQLQGTPYQTYTDALGIWSIEAPIGNYDGGIHYSKANFTPLTDGTTVTVTESGSFAMAEKQLQQVAANLTGTIDAPAADDLSNIVIELTGLSGLAKGSTAVLSPNDSGFFTAEGLPLGEYQAKIYYPDGLHETLISQVNLTSGALLFDFGSKTLRQSYLLVNQGQTYTNQRQVSLEVGYIDAVQMALSEGLIQQPKEDFAGNISFTLSEGDGEKTVQADLWDAQGQPLPSLTDSIILDTQLSVSSFTVTAVKGAASTKGDNLLVSLDIGEPDADTRVSLPGIAENMPLLDNGTGGDSIANDGIYQRSISISSPVDLNAAATVSIIDRAGNTLTAVSDSNLVLNIPPTILNLQVSSNVAEGSMSISFSTDEPTTSSIQYGDAFTNLNSTLAISSALKYNHEVALSGLPGNQLTYFRLVAQDAIGNETSVQSKGKLAPPAPENISAQAGDAEVGLIWDEVTTEGVVGYFVYRSENDSAFIRVNSSPIEDPYYLDSFVANDNRYRYRVTATDGVNESEQSPAYEVTPGLAFAGPTELAGGVIDKDTIWLKSRSPYRVTADIKQDWEVTLAMLPGAKLELVGDDRTFNLLGEFIGYGTEADQVSLTTVEYQSRRAGGIYFPTVDEFEPGSLFLTQANIDNFSIKGYGSYTKSWVKDSEVIFDDDVWSGGFGINSIRNSAIVRKRSVSTYREGIRIGIVLDSVFNVDGAGSDFATFRIGASFDSVFNRGRYNFSRHCYGCFFEGAVVDDYQKISGSSFDGASKINANFGSVEYSVIGMDTVVSAHNGKFSYNYWGGASFSEITRKVLSEVSSYDSIGLFPIISSPDIYQADNDGDGIPDYIDNDNDNDGYSDQQEFGESDPEFDFWYNPMDSSSHPTNEKDNDFDGITDALDHDDDNDGLSDDDELVYLTNPFIADSDGDKAKDGDEVAYQYDPKDKANFPYVGSIGNIDIAKENVNANGYTYWLSGGYKCDVTGGGTSNDCYFYGGSVFPGVKMVLASSDSHARYFFDNVDVLGESSDIFFIRSLGNKVDVVLQHGTFFRYGNVKISGGFNNHYEVSNSDVYAKGFVNDYGSYFLSSSLFDHNNYTGIYDVENRSVIEDSFVSLGVDSDAITNRGVISGSFLNDVINTSGAIVENSFADELYVSDFDLKLNAVGVVSNLVQGRGWVVNSDITMQDYNNRLFLSGVFLQNTAKDSFYSGLGDPGTEDQVGDGVAETSFTLDGVQYLIDGITSPASKPNYPGWVDDPSVKQYFWNPSQVGALWDPSNPNVFPDPLMLP